MQIKTIYVNESNFGSANLEPRQVKMIYIFVLRIFEH